MDQINMVGFVAGLLTTVAFIPQVCRTYTTKSTQDISLGMFSIFSSGVFMWIVYGVLMSALPIIVTNVITLVLAISILVMKVKYG